MEVLRAKCEFKGISIPRIADLEPHRADLEAGWIHMLEHQLPALLPVATFWDVLPEIFNWLRGAVTQPLAAMPIGAGNTVIRERVVDLPAGSRGQSLIEMIRFAAANRLLVEIDYRDKQGNRSTRAIEAYLRRRDNQIVMTVEHRAAPGLNDVEIELADDGQGPALRLRRAVPDEAAPTPHTPEQRIIRALADAEKPLSQAQIRKRAAVRNATVSATLHKLLQQGRVERAPKACYRLARRGGRSTAAPPALRDGDDQHDAFPEAFPANA